MKKIWIGVVSFVALWSTDAAAEVVTLRCSDSTIRIDITKHVFAWFNSQGKNETAAQGRVQFQGQYVTYGLGNPYPMRVNPTSGQVYRWDGGHWDYAETCSR